MTRENLKLVAVAAFCLTVGLAGPSVAGAVQKGLNADQVDGRHAVGAKAKIVKRKNKLVATTKQGYLPDNIVRGQAALRTVSISGFAISGTNVGMFGTSLRDAEVDTGYLLVTLPPSYRTGTPVIVDVTYRHNAGASCKVSLQTIGERVSPTHGWSGGVSFTLPNGLSAGSVSLAQGAGNLRLRLTETPVAPLVAGDTIGVRIVRQGNDGGNDTCIVPVFLSGALVRF